MVNKPRPYFWGVGGPATRKQNQWVFARSLRTRHDGALRCRDARRFLDLETGGGGTLELKRSDDTKTQDRISSLKLTVRR